jgi:hypothetical protein
MIKLVTESSFALKKNRGKISVRVMVFNTTFNNISVISWRSVLLVEETTVSENIVVMSKKVDECMNVWWCCSHPPFNPSSGM